MSEFFGEVKVATISGQIYNYKVCLSESSLMLKTFIERDTGIPIKQQKLFFNKVKQWINQLKKQSIQLNQAQSNPIQSNKVKSNLSGKGAYS